jgi:hypothetical protein
MTFEEFVRLVEVKHKTVHDENRHTDTYYAYATLRLQCIAQVTATDKILVAKSNDAADNLAKYMQCRAESMAINRLWVDVCNKFGIAHAATGEDTDRCAEYVRKFAKEILPVIKESRAYNEVDYMAFLHALLGLGIIDDAYYEECVNDVFA